MIRSSLEKSKTSEQKSSDASNAVGRIGVIGLGYVGLPLAMKFGSRFNTVGYDIKEDRIFQLRDKIDETNEVSTEDLENSKVMFSSDRRDLGDCDFFVVTVPTPIDESNRPDLSPLASACEMLGGCLQPGGIVVFESTVYPGVTEDFCVPIIERASGLTWKEDFFVGYSPERINPGDKERTIDKIVKVVSGDSPQTTAIVEAVYQAIIPAGIHVAESIRVAEAAKVIENTQRDLNIALMNELSIIFNRLGISAQEVLRAAGTKWNFLKFTPGLVGGHCIGVDPFYLTHCAQQAGYYPEMILAGRRINDSMAEHIASETIKLLCHAGKNIRDCRVLMLGLTFKENVPDIRNSKVVDVVSHLKEYAVDVVCYDPLANPDECLEEMGVQIVDAAELEGPFDAVVVAVAHEEIRQSFTLDRIVELSNGKPVLMDVKWVFDKQDAEAKGILHWQL